MANLPYIVYGTITDTDASNPSNARVVLRNDTTGEKLNVNTNSNGSYLFDAGNLTSGYLESDRLTVICRYGDAEVEDDFLISDSPAAEQIDMTLVASVESSDCTYAQPQDVLEELGDKTISDISYSRLRKAILRAEKEIEERSNTKFSSTTATDETHDYNMYNSYQSPDSLRSFDGGINMGTRGDYMSTWVNDKFQLENYPIISITELSINTGNRTGSDNWGTALTEQTGSGGSFVVEYNTGRVTFLSDVPGPGVRKVKVTYNYGYATVPLTVEKLTILLSVRDIITSKRTETQFDGNANVNLGDIAISKFDNITYFNWLNDEITRLYEIVGKMIQLGV